MSIIFGYRYFHKSADGYLGIFKGVVELFRSMFYTVSHNRCKSVFEIFSFTFHVRFEMDLKCIFLPSNFMHCMIAFFNISSLLVHGFRLKMSFIVKFQYVSLYWTANVLKENKRILVYKIFCRYINEKKMPNYNNTYGMYSIISAISLVINSYIFHKQL